jgi:hypothetical protein
MRVVRIVLLGAGAKEDAGEEDDNEDGYDNKRGTDAHGENSVATGYAEGPRDRNGEMRRSRELSLVVRHGGPAVGVADPDGEDFIGMNGHPDGVAGDGQWIAFGDLHQIGDGGCGCAGGNVKLDGRVLAGPLVNPEDEAFVVFGFFDGG